MKSKKVIGKVDFIIMEGMFNDTYDPFLWVDLQKAA